MTRLEDILATIEFSLNTKRKRHIVGGLLMSISLLFGGLALTTMTLKAEDDNDDGR